MGAESKTRRLRALLFYLQSRIDDAITSTLLLDNHAMNTLRGLFHGLVCGLLAFLLCSCGGGSSTPPPPSGNPAPSVQSLSPTSAAAGSNGFTLTITGSNFLSSSSVTWNSNSRQATFVSSSQLTIPIAASDLSTSGTVSVIVSNSTPGGGQSSANFTINAPAAPTLTSVSPNTLGAGTSAITLTVTGTALSRILWCNGVVQRVQRRTSATRS